MRILLIYGFNKVSFRWLFTVLNSILCTSWFCASKSGHSLQMHTIIFCSHNVFNMLIPFSQYQIIVCKSHTINIKTIVAVTKFAWFLHDSCKNYVNKVEEFCTRPTGNSMAANLKSCHLLLRTPILTKRLCSKKYYKQKKTLDSRFAPIVLPVGLVQNSSTLFTWFLHESCKICCAGLKVTIHF